MFHLPKMLTQLFIPEGIPQHVAEIIISWGALDKTMQSLSGAFAAQPECSHVAPESDSRFRRRAARFNKLSRTYFAPSPATVKFLDQFYCSLLDIQDERDLVAHGHYGFVLIDNAKFAVSLSTLNQRGSAKVKLYTVQEFEDLKNRVTRHLGVFSVLTNPNVFDLAPDVLTSQWKIPQSQIDLARTLLDRIHRYCQQATPEQYPRLPGSDVPVGVGISGGHLIFVPKAET